MNKLRILYPIAFIIICLSTGQLAAILFTGLVYGANTFEIVELLKDPINTDKSLIVILTICNSLFSFIIIPALYLLLYNNKALLNNLWANNKPRLFPFLLSIILILTIAPFITLLIKFNSNIDLPIWLSELEAYFKVSEEKAKQMTNAILTYKDSKELIIIVIVMAIIPGIAEEIFFRGMVQKQFQDILKNPHYAVFLAAILFSFFHFQFYGFIPRLVLGMLMGYIFVWSNNILYPIAIHVANNLIATLLHYHPELKVYDTENLLVIFSFVSIGITVLVIVFFKKLARPKI